VREVNGKLRSADDMGLDGGLVFCDEVYGRYMLFFFTLWLRFIIDALLLCIPPHCVSHDLRYTLLYGSRSFHAVPTISYLAIVFLLISDFLAFV